MAQPGQIVEGQLFLGFKRNGLPVWSQPGGIGTPVLPGVPQSFSWFAGDDEAPNGSLYQWPMNYPAQYYFGCGHPLNCPEIFSQFDKYVDDILAYICCPMCSFVQQIMPLAQYESYIDTPIVVA